MEKVTRNIKVFLSEKHLKFKLCCAEEKVMFFVNSKWIQLQELTKLIAYYF